MILVNILYWSSLLFSMGVEFSFILPCRNEQESIGFCIDKIKKVIKKNKLNAEIIVSDSSSDNSYKIAKSKKVKVVKHGDVGYGIAIKHGIKKAKGKYLIIGDCDGTYDFSEIPELSLQGFAEATNPHLKLSGLASGPRGLEAE